MDWQLIQDDFFKNHFVQNLDNLDYGCDYDPNNPLKPMSAAGKMACVNIFWIDKYLRKFPFRDESEFNEACNRLRDEILERLGEYLKTTHRS